MIFLEFRGERRKFLRLTLSNEVVIAAFGEYLQTHPVPARAATVPDAMAIVREFADAVCPIPLTEVTLDEIKTFEERQKPPSLKRSLLHRNMYEALAKLRSHQYRIVLFSFFRFHNIASEEKRQITG